LNIVAVLAPEVNERADPSPRADGVTARVNYSEPVALAAA
jgi:hypothetical protein